MLMSFAAGDAGFLEGTRWLDLFAGTGSVGLEALSRGATHCHFIELDPWVINNVLSPNIEGCGMGDSTLIHSGKAEAFLQRARDAPQFASKPFDYIRWAPFHHQLIFSRSAYSGQQGSKAIALVMVLLWCWIAQAF